MPKTQDEIYEKLKKQASYVSSGLGFNSDIFFLLSYILAYYRVRGSEKDTLASDALEQRIKYIIYGE